MMSKRFSWLARAATALLPLAALTTPASAQSWQAFLNSAQEPGVPNGSLGTGFAFVTLTGNLLSISVQFSGLTGTTTASHIHCCAAPGSNGAVATQVPSFAGFPLGVTSGAFSNTFDLTLASSWNPTFINNNGGTTAAATAVLLAGMNSGLTYLNIHTSTSPGGEIRGQLTLTPEPSTIVLLSAGLLGLAATVRRRKQA